MMRNIILHYHIFKNAGTSIDEILRLNFADKWLNYDEPAEDPGNILGPNVIAEVVSKHPTLVALSSHKLRPPVPQLDGINLFPFLILRHPIDRIGSIFRFEQGLGRRQMKGKIIGSAPLDSGLDAFCRWILDVKFAPALNLQTRFLSGIQTQELPSWNALIKKEDFQNALQTVSMLPVCGIVDLFEITLHSLAAWLVPVFPNLTFEVVAKNKTSTESDLTARLGSIKSELSPSTYEKLLLANRYDLHLYEVAREKLLKKVVSTSNLPVN